MALTAREMSQELRDAIANGGGGSVLIGATTPVDANENALWLRTGIGNSENGNIGGNPGNPDGYTGIMVKNAVLSGTEPDHEVTIETPFWFNTQS